MLLPFPLTLKFNLFYETWYWSSAVKLNSACFTLVTLSVSPFNFDITSEPNQKNLIMPKPYWKAHCSIFTRKCNCDLIHDKLILSCLHQNFHFRVVPHKCAVFTFGDDFIPQCFRSIYCGNCFTSNPITPSYCDLNMELRYFMILIMLQFIDTLA